MVYCCIGSKNFVKSCFNGNKSCLKVILGLVIGGLNVLGSMGVDKSLGWGV